MWRVVHLVMLLAVASLPAAAAAEAQQPALDHAGSLGVVVGMAPEYSATVFADCVICTAARSVQAYSVALDVGGTVAVGREGNEVSLQVRLVRLSSVVGESLLMGYRKYFGRDQVKTIFLFDLEGRWRPVWTGGARAGLGVMVELTPVLGAFVDTSASFGIGQGRRFGLELGVGLQARSYLLE